MADGEYLPITLDLAHWRVSEEDCREGDGLWYGIDHDCVVICANNFGRLKEQLNHIGERIDLIVSDLGIAYRREEAIELLGYLMDRDPKDDNLFPVQPAEKIGVVHFPNTKRYVYEPPPLPRRGFYNPEALWPMLEPEPDILDVTRDIARGG